MVGDDLGGRHLREALAHVVELGPEGSFGLLVDGLGDRLGPNVSVLRDALAQIRLAFVQVKGSANAPGVTGE